MKKLVLLCSLLVPALAIGAAPNCQSEDRGCAFIQTTVAHLQVNHDFVNLQLNRYVEAATARLQSDPESLAALSSAQSAWEAYRDAHCRAVVNPLASASGDTNKYSSCRTDLTRLRTHELWATYLKQADSSPPVLPEPNL